MPFFGGVMPNESARRRPDPETSPSPIRQTLPVRSAKDRTTSTVDGRFSNQHLGGGLSPF